MAVYKSLKQIGCQIIDDVSGRTLVAVSSLSLVRKSELKSGGNKAAAGRVGKEIAALALGKGIKRVVFDRRSYQFHGRVRSLADEARKAGLEF
jgi:large subunit ribosomal protein L18